MLVLVRPVAALVALSIVLPMGSAHAKGAEAAAPGGRTRPVHRITQAAGAIVLDGVLDEAAWSQATSIPLAFETRPAENTPPPVETDCLITHDADKLYVAFRAHDPEPSAIRAHLSDRDRAYDDDFVGIVLDPFNDERRAFEFFVNPLGVQMDMFMDDVSGNEDDSWDTLWSSAGQVTEQGYVVEIAIPFSSLRFPKAAGEQTWGFDALRFYPRSNRHRISSHPLDRNVSCYLCQASKMTGFSGVTPGKNVELVPTVTSGRTDRRENFPQGGFTDGDVDNELGLTAKWGITPNLTLNGALNPDFSQVEADSAQLDINETFALFFPEKRPFFLEGADFFRTPFDAVFTRNVADPSWGTKLTGKEGRNAVGLFVARDERTDFLIPGSQSSRAASLDEPSTDAVLRYRRDLGKTSALGVLLTSREGDGYANRLGGLDGLYRFGPSSALRAQYLQSETEYPAELRALGAGAGRLSDRALLTTYDYNSRNWSAYARYEDVGRDFRADMGFMPRVDYTFTLAGGSHTWHGKPDDRWTRMNAGADVDERKDQSGALIEREVEAWYEIVGPLQSVLNFDAGHRTRVFNGQSFEQTFTNTYFEFRPKSGLYLSLFMRISDELDTANTRNGDIVVLEPTVDARLGRKLRGTLTHSYQRLEVPGGELFTANLSQLKLVYQWNIRTFVRLITQYVDIARNPLLYTFPVDARAEELFTQALFSYKVNPQTVIFAGYSDTAFADESIDLTRESRSFFVKVGYAWVP